MSITKEKRYRFSGGQVYHVFIPTQSWRGVGRRRGETRAAARGLGKMFENFLASFGIEIILPEGGAVVFRGEVTYFGQ